MTGKNKPSKRHYVPQGYLRGFTETESVLFVANKNIHVDVLNSST